MKFTLLVIALWFSNEGTLEPEVISEEPNLTYKECVKLGEGYPVPNDSAITFMCVEEIPYNYEDFR